MLRVNTRIILNLPPFDSANGGNESLREPHDQLRIEQRLNYVGCGKLLSLSEPPRQQEGSGCCVEALHELDDSSYDVVESATFQVSCLYSLLRLDPGVCVNDSTTSGE
jgi:hypothetical protein